MKKFAKFLYIELDRQPHIDHLTSLYIGKMPKNEQTFDLEPLEDVVKHFVAQAVVHGISCRHINLFVVT